jgi:hypothetical protein
LAYAYYLVSNLVRSFDHRFVAPLILRYATHDLRDLVWTVPPLSRNLFFFFFYGVSKLWNFSFVGISTFREARHFGTVIALPLHRYCYARERRQAAIKDNSVDGALISRRRLATKCCRQNPKILELEIVVSIFGICFRPKGRTGALFYAAGEEGFVAAA